MIVRIPEGLVRSLGEVQAIMRRIREPFAEVGARLRFRGEEVELPPLGAEDETQEEETQE